MLENIRITPQIITSLKDSVVLMLGSNKEGTHGGDAARIAYEKFGAEKDAGIEITELDVNQMYLFSNPIRYYLMYICHKRFGNIQTMEN